MFNSLYRSEHICTHNGRWNWFPMRFSSIYSSFPYMIHFPEHIILEFFFVVHSLPALNSCEWWLMMAALFPIKNEIRVLCSQTSIYRIGKIESINKTELKSNTPSYIQMNNLEFSIYILIPPSIGRNTEDSTVEYILLYRFVFLYDRKHINMKV